MLHSSWLPQEEDEEQEGIYGAEPFPEGFEGNPSGSQANSMFGQEQTIYPTAEFGNEACMYLQGFDGYHNEQHYADQYYHNNSDLMNQGGVYYDQKTNTNNSNTHMYNDHNNDHNNHKNNSNNSYFLLESGVATESFWPDRQDVPMYASKSSELSWEERKAKREEDRRKRMEGRTNLAGTIDYDSMLSTMYGTHHLPLNK